MLPLSSAVKRTLKLRPWIPRGGFPAVVTGSRRDCSSRSGAREAAVSHASLLLRLQSCRALTEVRRLHAAIIIGGHGQSTVLSAQLVAGAFVRRAGVRRARAARVRRNAAKELLRVERRDKGPRRRWPVLGGAGAVLGHGPRRLCCR